MSDKVKIFFVIVFYLLFAGLPILLHILECPDIFIKYAFGSFMVIYSIFAMFFKIPVFNSHFYYKSYGFDNSFGIRHYFAFSILIFIGTMIIIGDLF